MTMKTNPGISLLNTFMFLLGIMIFWGCATPMPETNINTVNKRIVKPLPSIFRTKPSPLSKADSSRMAGIVVEYYLQASDLQLRDQHEEAIKIFKRILHLDTSAMIFYSMGVSYDKLLKTDLAIDYMKKALALDSQLIIAREALAELYVDHEQYDKALIAYSELDSMKSDIKYTYALAALTEMLFPEEAEKHFRKLINATGYELDIVNRFGMLLVRNGKEQEFISLMKEQYAMHPDNTKSRSLLIEGLQLYGRSEEVLNVIEDFLPTALDQELEGYYQALLMNILIRKDTQYVQGMIGRHLTTVKDYPTSSWSMLISLALMAEFASNEQMQTLHQRAVSLADSSHLQQSIGLAYELLRMERFSLFMSHCKRYAQHYPQESKFYFLLGIHAREQEQITEAKTYIQEALRRNPKDGDAWAELGGLFGNEKAHKASDSCFIIALSIDSLNAMYNNNYAYALSERNENLNEALRMSLIALSQYPDNQSYIDTYAWLQFKMGNTQSAIEILQKALNQDIDRSGILHFHLSLMYQSMSEFDKALIHIDKALEIKNAPDYQSLRTKLLQD
ncbi:MAG: tetratricopeptide repeat protein [Candidatus Kapaibacteriota bacterium]